jgi:hypothetical protein
VEECLAISGRLRDSVEQNGAAWLDTVPLTSLEARASAAAPVAEVAQRCGARFVASSAPLSDFAPLVQLYLLAGRDADAASLISRRLQSVSSGAERERAAVLDTAISAYLSPSTPAGNVNAQPARLTAGESLVSELGKLTTAAPWVMRMQAYSKLMDAAQRLDDTACARRAAHGIVTIANSLQSTDRRKNDFADNVRGTIYPAHEVLDELAAQDSLRRSTAGFVAIKRANWAKATGESFEAYVFPIGQQAPPIEADFSFHLGDAQVTRPTKGKNALVVFLNELRCVDLTFGPRCFSAYAQLRRLAQRFPELEITLVAMTHGYLGTRPPMPPAAEADTLSHWWMEQDQLPGALMVTATDFWRLPSPDRRRIDRDVANVTHYSFGKNWRVPELGDAPAFLVDRGGTIVDVSDLAERANEMRITRFLEALFAQQVATR